ncbi:MAG: CDP-glycerol glycerophosphotransferase family protein [Microlunatus sp.]
MTGSRAVRRARTLLSPHLHPALRASARRRLPSAPPRPRLVTVVIPVYNVEDYLDECLTSVVRQSHHELQIIVVDDGSTDHSPAIAQSYARWDRRITIVHQANAGLGAARNAGIARAQGTYLCFVDSDDVLPPGAIARMVATIQRSSSDFVVGALKRRSGTTLSTPEWVERVHARDRLGLRLADAPDILHNVFAWNKLFERSFFDSAIGGFPEGVLYEDQLPSTRAYAAGTFDVLKACTYHWRIRPEGSSITQQKQDRQNLTDRLAALSQVLPLVEATGGEVLRSWLRKTLSIDLRPYFAVVPRTDDCYWRELRQGISALAPMLDEELLLAIGFVDRYCALALIADRREDLCALLTSQDEYGISLPGVVIAGTPRIDPDFLGQLGFRPGPALEALADVDLPIIARIRSWAWHGDELTLTGSAFVSNLPTDPDSVTVQISDSEGHLVDVPTGTYHDSRVDTESGDAWNSHAWGSFRARLDVGPLSRARTWRLTVRINQSGLAWTGPLLRDLSGPAGDTPVARANERGRWIIDVTDDEVALRYRAAASVPVEVQEITDSSLTVRADPEVHTIRAVGGPGLKIIDAARDGTSLVLQLPARPAPGPSGHDYRLLAVTDLGRTVPASATTPVGSVTTLQQCLVSLAEEPDGSLSLSRRSWSATVQAVELFDGMLTIRGWVAISGFGELSAVLVAKDEEHLADELSLDAGDRRFAARFSVRALSKRWGFGFRLRLRQGGEVVDLWAPVDQALRSRFPLDLQHEMTAATFTRTPKAGALWVRLRHPYALDERGRLAQRRLHQRHQNRTGQTPAPAVLFDVFSGSSTSDSPRAMLDELRRRELDLELYWTVEDMDIETPPGARPLLIHSRHWIEVLSRACYLVSNHHFPFYFRKGPEQIYVQTWHGTPLKRIANDIKAPRQSLRYLALMKREAASWDYLLAQNDFAAARLPAAFGYDGPVINEGYPRNDALINADAAARNAVRQGLGLRDELAILYAPTWRDSTTGRPSLVNHLDSNLIARQVKSRARVLYRGHANQRHGTQPPPAPSLINVTTYPDVNDLILAADVLVTDYSSIMFDFCVTGKPMIFLVPDLEVYRDQTRGFYLDLELIAPGPLCRTTAEVIGQLSDLAMLSAEHAARYETFRQRFAPKDDGAASQRVVDRVWGS